MIIQERIGDFVRTYSDQGVYIHGGFPEADYAEAIDPASLGRTYTETNMLIEPGKQPDNLDESIGYLVAEHLIELADADEEPDYFHEHESDPHYFD